MHLYRCLTDGKERQELEIIVMAASDRDAESIARKAIEARHGVKIGRIVYVIPLGPDYVVFKPAAFLGF